MKLAINKSGLQLAVRATVAGAVSYAIAELTGLPGPIFAFIAAIIVTDLSPSGTARRGLVRFVATIIGAVAGALLSMLPLQGPIAIALGVLVAMLLCELLQMRDGAKVAGYLCGIVVLTHSDQPWLYALFRFIETVLGVAIAWALSYVPKLLGDDE